MKHISLKYIILFSLFAATFQCQANEDMPHSLNKAISATPEYAKIKAKVNSYIKKNFLDYQVDKLVLLSKLLNGNISYRTGNYRINTNIKTETFSFGAVYDF